LYLHDLPGGRPATVAVNPKRPGGQRSAQDLDRPSGPADRVDRVRREGDDRVQRPLGEFAMPEADREFAPIQVVLNGKNHRESVNRQSPASHGRASKESPPLLFRDQATAGPYTKKLGIPRRAPVRAKVSAPVDEGQPNVLASDPDPAPRLDAPPRLATP